MEKMLGYIFLNFSQFSNSKVTSEISGLRVPLTSSHQISFKTFGNKNASTNIQYLRLIIPRNFVLFRYFNSNQ